MKILSKDGFSDFSGFMSMGVKPVIRFEFSDGTFIRVTEDHQFLKDDDTWIYARDVILSNKFKDKEVVNIEYQEPEEVYDAINVKQDHAYYTNGLISHNCYLLYIDECAFIRGWDEFSASVLPTLSSGETTKMIFSSTPNGLNHYYNYVELARQGKSDFKLIEVPWYKVPGRDEAWRQKTLSQLNFDEQKFAVEYCCEFMGSSGTLISGAVLKTLNESTPLNIDRHIRQFEFPEKGRKYFLSADVSRGKGLDYSAFSVIDITEIPYKQVFVFRNNMISPSDYAAILNYVGRMYNDAAVLIEINDLGQQVADILYDYEYPTQLTTFSQGRKGKQLSLMAYKKYDKGIRTSTPVKATGCAALKLLVEQNKLVINDKWTIDELMVFSQNGNSYSAEEGKHDDMVMGLVLFAWSSVQNFFKNLYDTDVMNSLREMSQEEIEQELMPLGWRVDGTEDETQYSGSLYEPEYYVDTGRNGRSGYW